MTDAFQITDLTREQFDAIVWAVGVGVVWMYANGGFACIVLAVLAALARKDRAAEFFFRTLGSIIGTCLFGLPLCYFVLMPLVWWRIHE